MNIKKIVLINLIITYCILLQMLTIIVTLLFFFVCSFINDDKKLRHEVYVYVIAIIGQLVHAKTYIKLSECSLLL